jgi:hypothetical protein
MRTPLTLMALSIAFVVACDGNSNPASDGSGTGASGGSGGTPSSSLSGGAPSVAGQSPGTGGVANGTGGTTGGAPSAAGTATAGQHTGSAGAPASSGGTPASGGSGGTLGSGGVSSGGSGAPSAGMGGTLGTGGVSATAGATAAGSGAGGTSGASGDGSCSRDLLKSTVTAYFTALAAHDPSSLPLDASVKFTENGQVLTIGQKGLWTTAGMVKGSFSAYDTDSCNAATQAVVPDGTTDIPLALRVKLQNQKITEVETIAVRAGDYKVSGSSFASDTNALLASITSVHWEDPVPSGMQNTRDEISAWVNKYFVDFPNGVCNTTSDCKRLENGGGSFSCSAGASCMMGTPSKPAITPRLILVDLESGLGVGYDMFEGADDDTHMFKMYGGQVYAVSAILGAAGSSGWD